MHSASVAAVPAITSCAATPAISSLSDFSSFALDPKVITTLTRRGISIPTPIQERAIPAALEGRDIVGIAQTGTGKTLAFALPIIEKLQQAPGQALILVPTRELAAQVEETFRSFSQVVATRLSTVVLIGGASMHLQRQRLLNKPNVIVATPGRLQDLLNQRALNLSKVSVVVLDEADRMFDMGFAPQIRKILKLVPEKRQTMLFSATMPPEIASLTNSYLSNPLRIEVTPQGTSVEKIVQEICYVKQEEKGLLLEKVLNESNGLTIVFSRTKHGAKALTQRIKRMGHSSAEIHSNRTLAQRTQALSGFKSGKYTVLVATDIAARGIDVDDVQLVVNYDLPDAAPDYIHRIGRTGRAGKEGKAISFATLAQLYNVREIESLTKIPLITSIHSLPVPAARPARVIHRSGGGYRGGGYRRR
jgi:ATP-dependent RNA helicase RhlE